MKTIRRVFFASVAMIVAVAVLVPVTPAAENSEKSQKARFQYAAKFVCGYDPPPAFVRVSPGQYATSVAIHNPQNKRVWIRKKVALTFPPAEQAPGPVSEFLFDELGPDQALQVDCEEIGGHPPVGQGMTDSEFFPGSSLFGGGFPPYIQGFVIVESTHSLDVVAIVSVADLAPGFVPGKPETITFPPGKARSIDVAYVPERRIDDDDN